MLLTWPTPQHSSGNAFLQLATSTPLFVSYFLCPHVCLLFLMGPHILQPGPYLKSALHHVVSNITAYLPQVGTLALPLPVLLTTFHGWLVMANILLEGKLVDADRNCFLLDLLGAEGKCQLDWEANTMETEVTTVTHVNFHATIQLHLQLINAPQ